MDDGRRRCAWATKDELSRRYHDEEWGVPLAADAGHLERLALEIFQAGLSWHLMLVKREAFRRAFAGFDPGRVAGFGPRDVERLLSDPGIVRNRRKIEAVIRNASVFLELAREHGSFARWLDRLPGDEAALLAEFRRRFAFCGPEVTRSYLMSVGKLPAWHEEECWRHPTGTG